MPLLFSLRPAFRCRVPFSTHTALHQAFSAKQRERSGHWGVPLSDDSDYSLISSLSPTQREKRGKCNVSKQRKEKTNRWYWYPLRQHSTWPIAWYFNNSRHEQKQQQVFNIVWPSKVQWRSSHMAPDVYMQTKRSIGNLPLCTGLTYEDIGFSCHEFWYWFSS